jgi:hypothetical protein
MLVEVLYQDAVDIHNSVPISLKTEICKQSETLLNSFKSYFYLDCIKVEPWIRNRFPSGINFTEDVNHANDGS